MSNEQFKLEHPDRDVKIEFFDEDPDEDVDRAGDGYYFQLSGEDDWSGPWHSTEEASSEALDALIDRDTRDARAELAKAGFKAVPALLPDTELFSKTSDNGIEYQVEMALEGVVVYKVSASERVALSHMPEPDDDDLVGYARRSAAEAVAFVSEQLLVEDGPSAPKI